MVKGKNDYGAVDLRLDLHGITSHVTLNSSATIAETSEGLQGQSR